jgi:hypothetical protein
VLLAPGALVFLAACAAPQVGGGLSPPQLSGVHASEGVGGLRLEIPRLSPAIEHTAPLFKWLDPSESMSPAVFDLYRCNRWKCARPYLVTVGVNVRRVPAISGAGDERQRLREYVEQVIGRARRIRQMADQPPDHRHSEMAIDTLSFRTFENGPWARVERRAPNGRLVGVVYWRYLGPEFLMSASFDADIESLSAMDVLAFGAWFPEFVGRIGISGSPSNRRWP